MNDYVTKDDLKHELALVRQEFRQELRQELDSSFMKLFRYLDKRFKAVDDRFDAMDQKFSTLQTAVDTYRAEQETFRQECLAQGVKVHRLEDWAYKVAKKTDTPLTYP